MGFWKWYLSWIGTERVVRFSISLFPHQLDLIMLPNPQTDSVFTYIYMPETGLIVG